MYNVFPMLSIIESKYMYYELINCCKGSKKKVYTCKLYQLKVANRHFWH